MEWQDTLDEARRVVDDVRYHARGASGYVKAADWSRLGSVSDYISQVRAMNLIPAVDPGPPPPPPPTPAQLQGFGITYHYPGNDHAPAEDLYLGIDAEMGEWGQHWGHVVRAPASGRVEAYAFPTPLAAHYKHLDVDEQIAYLARHGAVGWRFVCRYGTQAMSIAVYWPDTPRPVRTGQTYAAAWFGHCYPNIAVGPVETAGRICTSWNSGINFELDGIPALASHIHCAGSATGQLSPNGDLDAFLIAEDFGWEVRDAGIGPGPNEYMTGQYRAGKPLWAWAGHPLPTPPPT